MKLEAPIVCVPCTTENTEEELVVHFETVEIRDDNTYNARCPECGGQTVFRVENQKFELLFEFGALALLDGYAREAVTSIAAALERFYEFYINVLKVKLGIPEGEFKKCWNFVSKQSERQLGVFFFLSLLENKSIPSYLNSFFNKEKIGKDSLQKFRNEVTHNGYIPTIDEVIKYGEAVLRFIFTVLKELKESSAEHLTRTLIESVLDESVPEERRVNFSLTLPTIISVSSHQELHLKGEGDESYSFRSELEKLNARQRERGHLTVFSEEPLP